MFIKSGLIFEFSFIIEASKPSSKHYAYYQDIGLIKSILHTDMHFGLTDIGQFAKWPIYIVTTMRMCKFKFSKTLQKSSERKVMKG